MHKNRENIKLFIKYGFMNFVYADFVNNIVCSNGFHKKESLVRFESQRDTFYMILWSFLRFHKVAHINIGLKNIDNNNTMVRTRTLI